MYEVVDVALAGIGEPERAALMSVLRQVLTNLSETEDERASSSARK